MGQFFTVDQVIYPEYLSPKLLPQHLKDNLIKEFDECLYNSDSIYVESINKIRNKVLTNIQGDCAYSFDDFINFCTDLDKIRGTNLFNTFKKFS
jgi:hypothetical protein